MNPVQLHLTLLIVAFLFLGGHCDSSSHSLQYFATGFSKPAEGLPQFLYVGYVDGLPFVQYDSSTKNLLPQAPWIKEVAEEDSQYWDKETRIAKKREDWFREDIRIIRNRYNQTEGFHTWQSMYGCELKGDGSKGGYWQLGYDGRDSIAFDKETLSWTAADAKALMIKNRCDAKTIRNQYKKFFLEDICIEQLQNYIHYGNKTLLRKEPPKMKVTSRVDDESMETLICRADGFYPKDIEVVWTRDGEVWEQETLRGLVAPNSDGTFHTWVSVRIDPKDRDRFQCRVDHASLEKPVDFPVEEPAPTFHRWHFILGLILLGAAIAVFFLIRYIIRWFRSRSRIKEDESGQALPRTEIPGIISRSGETVSVAETVAV